MALRISSASAHLRLEGIRKSFGTVAALEPLTLDIEPGSLVALLGPSGCGKTTTLRIVAGLEQPDAGRVLINGHDVTRVPPRSRAIGMVFQNYSLFPHMTVRENVAFGPAMKGEPRATVGRRVEEMLALVRLPGFAERYPSQLSGGQQQRVALARSLITDPDLLLLDEPLGALDKNLRESMQFELRQLQQRLGITTLLVTHDQEEALTMSDLVVVMRAGRIVQIGSPRDVYERPRTRFVSEFLGTSNLFSGKLAGAAGPGLQWIELGGDPRMRCRVPLDGAAVDAGELTFAVRPERMWFADAADADVNALEVEITGHVFRGGYHAYEARVAIGGQTIFVHRQAEDGESIRPPGSRCLASWRPAASVRFEEADQ
jgi:spermidine/putrescine ABC transporter ATP-binding subunit